MVTGCHLPVSEGPVSFCAKHLHHCTSRFSGRRLVMVAYSLQAFGHASESDRATLASLGFMLPSAGDTMSLRATGGSSSPVFMEVFAGSAGLTCAARLSGMRAIAVDWANNKHETKAASVNIDLSSNSGEATFFQMLEEKRPKAIHKPSILPHLVERPHCEASGLADWLFALHSEPCSCAALLMECVMRYAAAVACV